VHAARDALDPLKAAHDDARRLVGGHRARRHQPAEDRHVQLDVRAAERGERAQLAVDDADQIRHQLLLLISGTNRDLQRPRDRRLAHAAGQLALALVVRA
jgi:hypothetical protein